MFFILYVFSVSFASPLHAKSSINLLDCIDTDKTEHNGHPWMFIALFSVVVFGFLTKKTEQQQTEDSKIDENGEQEEECMKLRRTRKFM